ncbi:MAG: YbaK/EbsC family protein [Thermotaleaceae bacterium]
MFSVNELNAFLTLQNADFEFIKQDKPIHSAMDAEGYYPVNKSAPTFILESDDDLLACTMSINSGRLDFETLKQQFGYKKLKMAHREKVEKKTGYKVGSIPLIGHELLCIFDNNLLMYDYVYGGTGDELTTLKIVPQDIKRLNQVIHVLNSR